MGRSASLFLDSGAFTAWTRGQSINLDQYISFCLENLDKFDVITNLDVIPGEPFKPVTEEQIEESARKGWENYMRMVSAGIPKDKLIHVFHQGESFKWLERMVKEGIPYIGLSPANDKTTRQKMAWLDRCMDYVTDDDGFPVVKFHGFGVTSLTLMARYPWYSVDSTSWNVYARYGIILVPQRRGTAWVYDENAESIFVSSRSPYKKLKGKHIESLSPRQRDVVLQYITEKGYRMGKSRFEIVPETHELRENEQWAGKAENGKRMVEIIEEPGLTNSLVDRAMINMEFFQDFEKSLPLPRRFMRNRAVSLF